jgi:hypothetical protein
MQLSSSYIINVFTRGWLHCDSTVRANCGPVAIIASTAQPSFLSRFDRFGQANSVLVTHSIPP